MAKITLKEAFKQASVVEELKNFVGITKDDAVGLMTPERLAAVAGESSIKHIFVELNKKTFIAEGSGLLLMQQPYKNYTLTMLLICKDSIIEISDRAGLASVLSIEDEKVFITETNNGAKEVIFQSFLTKGEFYNK